MVMDQSSLGEFYGCSNGFSLGEETLSTLLDYNTLVNPVKYEDLIPSDVDPILSANLDGDSHEDFNLSDVVFKYINQMLMEEDIEEKACMFQESAALQAAERSFYELLGEQSSAPTDNTNQSHEILHKTSPTSDDLSDSGRGFEIVESKTSSFTTRSPSSSSYSLSSGTDISIADSPISTLTIPDIFSNIDSVMQFKRGFEEGSKFIPHGNNLFLDLKESDGLIKDMKKVTVTTTNGSRGKKNPHPEEEEDLDTGRSYKQTSIYTESPVRSELFDTILLSCGRNSESELREAFRNGIRKNEEKRIQSKELPNGSKSRSNKKKGGKRDVDLRTLLTLCAQATASNDRRNANELLNQIRTHASPTGDGMQRIAYYFANGLEARLAGSGTEIYTALITKPTSAADVLKAYHLFLAVCPFRKISNFFANKTIMKAADKATTLHIIDFGILYGFQWPCLIQRLASKPAGPPKKLRITGIDFPHPGFRPAKRVTETGCRLANYAESFNVPFEFNAIAKKWDTITIEDLKLNNDDELLVVNCLFRFRNLLDETVVEESPRDAVLKLIKETKPDVFIQGIVNGAYNAPFFITRFREALFHYSALFDMLEATVPREIPERMLIEKDLFGWEAMNVIACEGSERIERPETYKQWQVRNLRAGFKQLPLDREIVKIAMDRVENCYHKDFVIDEDVEWLMQGWKGRIVYGLSSWRC